MMLKQNTREGVAGAFAQQVNSPDRSAVWLALDCETHVWLRRRMGGLSGFTTRVRRCRTWVFCYEFWDERQMNDLALAIILFLVGMVLTIKGGDFFVDAASWIAERSGIPKLIIGAPLVAIGTSPPERITTIPAFISKRFARWQGAVLPVVYAGYVVLTCTR